MSKKDREGMSKRQEFREKQRRSEQRVRWIWIGVIVIVAVLVAFFVIYGQLKPVASIQARRHVLARMCSAIPRVIRMRRSS